jgi:hypothetical protein
MSLALSPHPNAVPAIKPRIGAGLIARRLVHFMLVFRLVGFAAVQAIIAALFAMRGVADPWVASIAWWPLVATIVSLLTAVALARASRREGIRYVDLLNARRGTIGRDALWFLLLSALAGPVGYLPMMWLSEVLFGDPQAASALMFKPLPPIWAAILFVSYPLTVALTELPTYFGYVMPRLEALAGPTEIGPKVGFFRKNLISRAVLLPVFFLAAQHATLPLIFDWRFIVWRIGMFLPFALLLGVALHWRPRLMPYFMLGHFLIDLSSAYFFYSIS